MTYDDHYKKIRNTYTVEENKQKADADSAYNQQKIQVTDAHNNALKETRLAYSDPKKHNALARLINKRRAEERMADMGLSDSGLRNVLVDSAEKAYLKNRDTILNYQNKAEGKIKTSLTNTISQIEKNQQKTANEIKTAYDNLAKQNALKSYNAELKAIQERNAAARRAAAVNNSIAQTSVQKPYKGLISKNGGLLSYNFQGSLKNSGVTVTQNTNGSKTYRDAVTGFSTTIGAGVNPYTGKLHNDVLTNGRYDPTKAFSNGYQPNNIGGVKVKTYMKEGVTVQGRKQTLWQAGGKYYYWSGGLSKYVEIPAQTVMEYTNKGKSIEIKYNGLINNSGKVSWDYKGGLSDNGVTVSKNADGSRTYSDKITGNVVTVNLGYNPYTGGIHNDLLTNGKYDPSKAFSNGYQPNNIGGIKLKVYKSGGITLQGRKQNIWKAGDKYYYWLGGANEYVEIPKSGIAKLSTKNYTTAELFTQWKANNFEQTEKLENYLKKNGNLGSISDFQNMRTEEFYENMLKGLKGEKSENTKKELKIDKTGDIIYHGDISGGKLYEDMNTNYLSKEKLIKMKWINWSDLTGTTKEEHINAWKQLARATSTGEMQSVVLDMIDHFVEGSGDVYSNDILTEKIKNHKETKRFINDFIECFREYLIEHNGDYSTIFSDGILKGKLRDKDVLLTKYNYEGIDMLTGLEMAVHNWTESDVEVISYQIKDGKCYGTLKFTFVDNFGLDQEDINKYGAVYGFRSWYILQHYEKYKGQCKPFRTVVQIKHDFEFDLEHNNEN